MNHVCICALQIVRPLALTLRLDRRPRPMKPGLYKRPGRWPLQCKLPGRWPCRCAWFGDPGRWPSLCKPPGRWPGFAIGIYPDGHGKLKHGKLRQGKRRSLFSAQRARRLSSPGKRPGKRRCTMILIGPTACPFTWITFNATITHPGLAPCRLFDERPTSVPPGRNVSFRDVSNVGASCQGIWLRERIGWWLR